MPQMEITVQPTPNPNALKFTLDRPSTDGAPKTYRSAAEAADHPAARGLFGIAGVTLVFMTANFISVQKSDQAEWDEIVPRARRAIEEGFRAV